MSLTWLDIFVRLSVASAAGAVLGFERSRQNRAIMGFRTLSLVGLASCTAVLAITASGLPQLNADGVARVIQGTLAGVGFIGAGAILQRQQKAQVHGLATAASIWVSAALGVAAALSIWPLVMGGLLLALLILLVGPEVERRIRAHAREAPGEEDRQDLSDSRSSD